MRNLPAYRRIYEDLAGRIESGELRPESRMPGDVALAERYGVSKMTVRQALAALVDRSLVQRRQGVGTFVSGDKPDRRSLNRLTSFTEDMSGQKVSTRILAQEVSAPPAEIESLIDSPIHGFNTHDNNLFFTVFGDTAQTTWLEHLGSTSGMAQSRR